MIGRREFIESCGRVLLLGYAGSLYGCAPQARKASFDADALLRNIESLRSRDYSERGVSMLLTGENLRFDVKRVGDLGGARLARMLQHYADLLLKKRPDAEERDVAALVEVIAEQDFVDTVGEQAS